MASIQTSSGRKIFYDETGDGPPLLMLVGYTAVRTNWAPLVPALSRQFRVITMDNRDAGQSDPESEAYTIADLAGDAAALLGALGIERAHVAGHSMGGFIALQLAVDRPERVDRLVLVSTAAAGAAVDGRPAHLPEPSSWIKDPVERARTRYRGMAAPGYFDAHAEQLDELASLAAGNRLSFAGMTRQSLALQTTYDVRRRLGDVAAPTLILHGEVDSTIPIRAARTLEARIPGARLVALPGVGHLPQWERVDELIRLIAAFLQE